jgi:hypothetical protein
MQKGFQLILFNIVLLVMTMGMMYLALKYSEYKMFYTILGLGLIVVMLASFVQYFFAVRGEKEDARRQQGSIVPSYCPDYWTKSADASGKMVCHNGFSTKNEFGQTVTYRFSDPKVPKTIDLNVITDTTNTNKCFMFGNPIQFPAPWLEMKNKCDAQTMST